VSKSFHDDDWQPSEHVKAEEARVSEIAKTTRERLECSLDEKFPRVEYDSNAKPAHLCSPTELRRAWMRREGGDDAA